MIGSVLGSVRPTSDAWVAAVHGSESGGRPLGTAVVVDPVRLLTSAHVVRTQIESESEVWVSFPKADNPFGSRQRVAVRIAPEPKADLAVLELSDPIPSGVEVARLRSPRPLDLLGHHWWAFGFPASDPYGIGNSADGTVGDALAYGWVRLDTNSRYLVERGFSGGGLWSDYGDGAVVGIVGQANDRGDGRALPLYVAGLAMPDENLEDLTRWSAEASGLVALQSWGWSLATDPEAIRHWRPRARGVAVESEVGYRFRGRMKALQRIVAWLDRPTPDGRVLVVTGSPGVGKSAVLGRVVTTADPQLRAALPGDDAAAKAPLGSIGCAVHAKGKTALEVAREIAAAASAPMPDQVEDFAPLIRDGLIDHTRQRFNVIVDAVDEAQSPSEARLILTRVVLRLSQTCADVGANLVVGTRTHDSGGNLVNRLGAAAITVNLDDPRYSSIEDLTDYAIATLQLLGNGRADNPYAAVSVAAPVAHRIATLSEGNYLVAGLVGRTHGQYDQQPVDPATLTFDSSVDDAFGTYLQRVQPFQHITATDLLTPLAYAEAPGLTAELWRAALGALTGHVLSASALARFAATAAAAFVVQAASQTGASGSYRLFHQALSEALVKTRVEEDQSGDEETLMRTFLALGTEGGWDSAPPYLLRSLPGHAERAGHVDDLLINDSFLLHADLRRLIPAGSAAVSAKARDRLRLLRLSTRAIDAEPSHRESIFSVTAAMHGLTPFRTNEPHVPYRAVWAHAAPAAEYTVLEGHTGRVNAVCAVTVDGRQLLASAGHDQVVRLWDPASGAEVRALQGHTGRVNAVCAVTVDDRQLMASAGYDQVVRLWDPASGAEVRALQGHTGRVNAVCAVTVDDRQLMASAGHDQVVRLWDPASGAEIRVLEGHTSEVFAVCAVTVDGRRLLASAGHQVVRLWDPASGAKVRALEGHTGRVSAVCAVTVDDRQLLASAGDDEVVRLWDPASGAEVRALEGDTGRVFAVCAVTVDDRQLLASAGYWVVRLWDPASGAEVRALEGHTGPVDAACAVTVDGQQLLASAGVDQVVRLWDPASGAEVRALARHTGRVDAVCAVTVDGRQLLASAGFDQVVRLWDPASGAEVRALARHTGRVRGVCAVTVDGRQLLASAADDQAVRLWDPASGAKVRALEGHTGRVSAVCAVTVDDRQLLASAGYDQVVRLWDPASGAEIRALQGHTSEVFAVCAVTVDGRQLLASAGGDQVVRLWDPASGAKVRALERHTGRVDAVCAVTVDGRQLLASAGYDQVVRLWDPASGAEIRALQGHTSEVNAVCAVTVDGRQLLASAADDWVVRLWDPASGNLQYSVHLRIIVRSLIALGTGTLIAAHPNGLLALSLQRE